eukprot:6007229-Pleurochrysis_carterae.AAC.1
MRVGILPPLPPALASAWTASVTAARAPQTAPTTPNHASPPASPQSAGFSIAQGVPACSAAATSFAVRDPLRRDRLYSLRLTPTPQLRPVRPPLSRTTRGVRQTTHQPPPPAQQPPCHMRRQHVAVGPAYRHVDGDDARAMRAQLPGQRGLRGAVAGEDHQDDHPAAAVLRLLVGSRASPFPC